VHTLCLVLESDDAHNPPSSLDASSPDLRGPRRYSPLASHDDRAGSDRSRASLATCVWARRRSTQLQSVPRAAHHRYPWDSISDERFRGAVRRRDHSGRRGRCHPIADRRRDRRLLRPRRARHKQDRRTSIRLRSFACGGAPLRSRVDRVLPRTSHPPHHDRGTTRTSCRRAACCVRDEGACSCTQSSGGRTNQSSATARAIGRAFCIVCDLDRKLPARRRGDSPSREDLVMRTRSP